MEGLSSRGQNGESARVDRLPIEDDNSTPVMIFLIVAGPVFCEPVCSFYRRARRTPPRVGGGKNPPLLLGERDVFAKSRSRGAPKYLKICIGRRTFTLRRHS